MDVWELMSQECRDEVVLIDSSCLLETLETYLRKHRYVQRAKTRLHFEEYVLHFFVNQNVCRVHTMCKSVEDSSDTLKTEDLSFVLMENLARSHWYSGDMFCVLPVVLGCGRGNAETAEVIATCLNFFFC